MGIGAHQTGETMKMYQRPLDARTFDTLGFFLAMQELSALRALSRGEDRADYALSVARMQRYAWAEHIDDTDN